MDIGSKIRLLFNSRNFKNYQEFGKFVETNGDWCLDLSKRKVVTMTDITRLKKICDKFEVTLDWLLSEENIQESTENIYGFSEDDIAVMIDNIIKNTSEQNKFYGTKLNKDNSELLKDALDEVKKLIKDNL